MAQEGAGASASMGFKLFLAIGMLVAGSFNTIAVKLADQQSTPGYITETINPVDPPCSKCSCNSLPNNVATVKDLDVCKKSCLDDTLCKFVEFEATTGKKNKGAGTCSLLAQCFNRTEEGPALLLEKDNKHMFNHPIFQSLTMFVGEFFCLLAFQIVVRMDKTRKYENPVYFNPLVFFPASVCDMTGTSLMYIGLTKTYSSVFQMLRGSVVIFTGLLSVTVLRKKLFAFHWLGMFFVLCGLALVGVASVINAPTDDPNATDPITGDILVICAQIIVAIQMVYEEKFIGKYDVPALQAVGWEGVWGCVICLSTLTVLYFTPGSDVGGRVENSVDALVQMSTSGVLMFATVGIVISIAFFNYFGISVTKTMSATTRMVLDSLRTIIIWGFSLIVAWEKFQGIQVVGFVVLLFGTCVYNKIFKLPCLSYKTPDTPLLTDAGPNPYAPATNDAFPPRTDSPLYNYGANSPAMGRGTGRAERGNFKPSART